MKTIFSISLIILCLRVSGQEIETGKTPIHLNKFQIEFAGAGFKIHDALYLYFNLGMNLPAKKRRVV